MLVLVLALFAKPCSSKLFGRALVATAAAKQQRIARRQTARQSGHVCLDMLNAVLLVVAPRKGGKQTQPAGESPAAGS